MNLKKKNLLCLFVIVTVTTFPVYAFADDGGASTATPLWVSLAALLVGYCTQAWQTGILFGKKTLPKPYVPYVGAVAAFGTAFLAAIPAGATISEAVLKAAAFAGLQALVAMAFGVVGHVVQTANKSSRGVAAMNASKSDSTMSTLPPPPSTNDNGKSTPPPAAALVLLGFLALQNEGCALSSAPVVPVTPANQAQVSSCQNTATLHNSVVIGGFALSAGGAGLAGVSAAEPDSNGSLKTALGIAGAIVGGVALFDAAVAELSNSNFQNSKCGDVVGPLPTSPNPKPAPAPSAEVKP
jgi:hypothetical protein